MTQIDMKRYETTVLPMADVFCDSAFNCRGLIAMSECSELAKDIKERGLDFPIHVQPYNKGQYKYRIVSGHRRYTAFKVNKTTEIPAVIRHDLTDELAAREANLRENIQRSDLTMVQEADAIDFFIRAGNSVNQIANRLGKSNGWVEVRRKLLNLPDVVKTAAASGVVTQNHINQMWQYRSEPQKLVEMIRTIKERSEKGERSIVIKEDVKITDFAKARRPKPHEINDFLEVIARNITNRLQEGDECFAHRVLAWCAGNISPAQLYVSLRKECTRLGLPFNPPTDIARILNSVAKV